MHKFKKKKKKKKPYEMGMRMKVSCVFFSSTTKNNERSTPLSALLFTMIIKKDHYNEF